MESNWHRMLLELSERFNLEELKNMCFVLEDEVPDLDFENLKGDSKGAKYRELIAFMEDRQKIPGLLGAIAQLRPDLKPQVSDIQAKIQVGIEKPNAQMSEPSLAPVLPVKASASKAKPQGFMRWWGSLGDKTKLAYLGGVFVLLIVAFCGLTGTLFSPVIAEWAKTLLFRPTVVAVTTATLDPTASPTTTNVVPSHTPTSTPLVPPAAINSPPSPIPWPPINTLAFPDPEGRCSITAAYATDLERPNTIKIMFDTQAEKSWCIWEVRLMPDYDASKKTTLSFWVKGEKGGEQFGVGLKDSITPPGQEPKVIQTASAEWRNVLIPLSDFQNLKPQNLSALENYSLSFTHDWGSGTIYVDGFVFEP